MKSWDRAVIVSCLVAFVPHTARLIADEASASATLETRGLRVSGSQVVTPQELKLSGGLRKTNRLRKELAASERELALLHGQAGQLQEQMAQLTQRQINVSSQLAQLNAIQPAHVGLNNQLVGALHALQGQQDLQRNRQSQIEQSITAARAEWHRIRDQYLQEVLALRALVDEAQALVENCAQDPELQRAVQELSAATGKALQLKPSRGLQSASRRLLAMEREVVTESIPLRRQGDTLYAAVVVNGQKPQEMVVDSGASLISLPADVADSLGVVPQPTDPAVRLTLADGREIQGRIVTLEEVRLGQFRLSHVQAAVLGPDAPHAPPLLGMSFLGSFKFEIDAQAAKLNMVAVGQAGAER